MSDKKSTPNAGSAEHRWTCYHTPTCPSEHEHKVQQAYDVSRAAVYKSITEGGPPTPKTDDDDACIVCGAVTEAERAYCSTECGEAALRPSQAPDGPQTYEEVQADRDRRVEDRRRAEEDGPCNHPLRNVNGTCTTCGALLRTSADPTETVLAAQILTAVRAWDRLLTAISMLPNRVKGPALFEGINDMAGAVANLGRPASDSVGKEEEKP